ncbi:MAG: hypothetical protein U0237_20120 [Thermoleophilia bacterium]
MPNIADAAIEIRAAALAITIGAIDTAFDNDSAVNFTDGLDHLRDARTAYRIHESQEVTAEDAQWVLDHLNYVWDTLPGAPSQATVERLTEAIGG